jgi:hypothetical protein
MESTFLPDPKRFRQYDEVQDLDSHLAMPTIVAAEEPHERIFRRSVPGDASAGPGESTRYAAGRTAAAVLPAFTINATGHNDMESRAGV